MNLLGIHHVSAFTANAKNNIDFYTNVLGMRLVKKSVNQDNPFMYHLFFADKIGTPGTGLTFFEIPNVGRNHNGNNSISATSLRVKNDAAIDYWLDRFQKVNVENDGKVEQFGRLVLPFRDPENQRLILISDETNEGVEGGIPWENSAVPEEYQIIGLGPSHLTVPDLKPTEETLVSLMGFKRIGEYEDAITKDEVIVYETGKGGTGTEIHVHVRPDLPKERLGRGGVHHVAFRVENETELRKYVNQLTENKISNSGYVDRYYFHSAYFNEPNGILYELATDEPGFTTDEDEANLGKKLALPPFLEPRREEIEGRLTPLK